MSIDVDVAGRPGMRLRRGAAPVWAASGASSGAAPRPPPRPPRPPAFACAPFPPADWFRLIGAAKRRSRCRKYSVRPSRANAMPEPRPAAG